jgi:hypothetical protein
MPVLAENVTPVEPTNVTPVVTPVEPASVTPVEPSNVTQSNETVNETQPDIGPVVISKYVPIPTDPISGTGILEISVLCHHNLFSKEMTMERVDDGTVIPFTSGGRITKEQFTAFKKVEGAALNIELRHDGTFSDRYAPGVYAIKLLDGNGGQPEYAVVKVESGFLSRVQFIGHAVSSVGTQVEPDNPCKDLVITTGDISRTKGKFFTLYWFRIDVTNPNDMFTRSNVEIKDSQGHTLYDFPIFALTGDSYSFYMPTIKSHWDHEDKSLTVTVSGTQCTKPCNPSQGASVS